MGLFDTAGFMPHGHCFLWRPGILWLHVGSDFATALAYYSIPLALAWFVKERRDLVFRSVFLLFAAFILACGTTHLFSIWTMWHPSYGAEGAVKATTAGISLFTAALLWRLMPEALALPSPSQLRQANEALAHENAERRRAEDELRALALHLERRVAERTASVERANLDLHHEIAERERAEAERERLELQVQNTQKLESLGILAGGIAHDFNNLLAGILGNATFALGDLPASSPLREPLHDVELSATRAAELTRQLLVYSGRATFERREVDLSALVREMRQLLRASLGRNRVLYQLAPALPSVQVDPTQLRQIVMNLLSNAAEAMEGANGTIRVTTEVRDCGVDELRGGVLADDLPAGRYVALEVRDEGCGMDPQTVARIFDPFFSTKFVGRGLGLAAVLGIVRAHRGAILVVSEPGVGTVFDVLLPASQAAAVAESPDEAAPVEPWKGSGSVLVVDDEEVVRRLAARVLQIRGYSVISAASGADAWAVLSRNGERVVAALIDVTMPGESGIDVMRALRALRPGLPVVLMSGFAPEQALAHLGDDEALFVGKPFQGSELIERLREALARRA